MNDLYRWGGTKYHDSAAPADQSFCNWSEHWAWRRISMYEDHLLSFLWAPFVDSHCPIGCFNISSTRKETG